MKIGRTIEIVKSVIIYYLLCTISYFSSLFFSFAYLLLHDNSQHFGSFASPGGTKTSKCLIQSEIGTAMSSIMVDFLYSNVNNNHSGDCYLNYRT